MPPIRHGTLVIVNMVTALLGQWLMDGNPKTAILILGVSLACALIDGWWYLFPLRFRWWYPALIGFIGLTMWQEPRGWFFLAWAAIELGTGLRAETFYRQYLSRMAEEQERQRRLAALGFGSPPEEAPAEEEVAANDQPGPRFLPALAGAVLAAGAGAWLYLLVYRVTQIRVDLVAIAVGFLVGRAVLLGAGGRSNPALQWVAAVLSGLGVVGGQYLILRAMVLSRVTGAISELELFQVIVSTAPRVGAVDVFLLVFVFFASLMAWRVSRDPSK